MYRVTIQSIKQDGATTCIRYLENNAPISICGYALQQSAYVPQSAHCVYTRDDLVLFYEGERLVLKLLLTHHKK